MTKVVKRTAPKRVRVESFKTIEVENLKPCTLDELIAWQTGIAKLTKTSPKVDEIRQAVDQLIESQKEVNAEGEAEKRDESLPAHTELPSVETNVLVQVSKKTKKEMKKQRSDDKKNLDKIAKAITKANEKKKSKGPVSKKGETKPGIIASILDVLTSAGSKKDGISKAAILDYLVSKFPERDVEKMKATVSVQVPGRISREKGISLEKLENGNYKLVK